MIVTLTKLFVMSIVANVRSESFLSMMMSLSFAFSSSSSARSFGERLKNAISEPLAKPDMISNKIVIAKHINTERVGAVKWTSDNMDVKDKVSKD